MAHAEPFETYVAPERCILVGIDTGVSDWDVHASLDELSRLAETAGAIPVGRLTQRLDHPIPKTFLGSGKVVELKELAETLNVDVVIFDNELTPSQQANLERLLGMKFKIIDRTALILDIFGMHASTHEGKLQVQMAQLSYLYPRLRGMWAHLAKDRTRGGIGSRFGQGESQLEVDRRLIRNRMATLRAELKRISGTRDVQRKDRYESDAFRIALAGYTNAGKSTLLNHLTKADVYVQDQLFATLDPTTRTYILPGGRVTTVTDTVGFVQKLPHTLVESFKSTLAEVNGSNLILHVIDATDAHREHEMKAVDEVLDEIGASEIPSLMVFNKCDLLDEVDIEAIRKRYPGAICVSGLTGFGIDTLIERLSLAASSQDEFVKAVIPYNMGVICGECHKYGRIIHEDYLPEGTLIEAVVPRTVYLRMKPYLLGEDSHDASTDNGEY